MNLLVFKLIVVATLCELIACTGYFTLVGSKLLRQNGKYNIAVTSHNYNNDEVPTLEVTVQNSNGNFKTAQNLSLTNGKSHSLEFDLKGRPIDDYTIRVKSVKGQEFEKVVKIYMKITENVLLLVQTDKTIYKPCDTVYLRVLVSNNNMHPLESNYFVQIIITDGAGNRVKQVDDVILIKGFFQGIFKIPDLPVFGEWHISVNVNSQKEITKVFEVVEHTIPNSEVTIDVNPHITFDDRKIRATILAKHSSGEIANGIATVKAKGWNDCLSKSFELNGTKLVEFDIENELGIKTPYEGRITLFATFKETLTGIEQNAFASVHVHLTPFKIKLKTQSQKFKPGLPFNVKAIKQYHDSNMPVTDFDEAVRFTTKFYFENKKCQQPTRRTFLDGYNPDFCVQLMYEEVSEVYPSNGIAEIDIQIPDQTKKLDVTAKYLETDTTLYGIQKLFSESNQYIKITLRNERPRLTEDITINIVSTQIIDEFSYHVLTLSGEVVSSDTIQIMPAKSIDFEISPTYRMLPKVKIVLFYITDNGKIISDSLELEFDSEIDIQISQSRMAPNELISITSNPNSFVGLFRVDKSTCPEKPSKSNVTYGKVILSESEAFDELKLLNEMHTKFVRDEKKNYLLDFQPWEVFIITNTEN